MNEELWCPSCEGPLEQGFVCERGHYNGKMQQVWVEGEPEESFWSGLKTSGRDARYVSAYRCSGCGRLEFYAVAEAEI